MYDIKLVAEISRIYSVAEMKIIDNLKILDVKSIGKVRRNLNSIFSKLKKDSEAELKKVAMESYQAGNRKDAKIPKSVQKMQDELITKIRKANEKAFKNVGKNYRDLLQKDKDEAEKLLEAIKKSGISSFMDKAGRRWNMRSYAEMLTRTITSNANLQGVIDRQKEAGKYLVRVSSHAKPCPLCLPWTGKILSIKGDSQYGSLQDAKNAGLFHPNCKHSLIPV